MTIRAKSRGTGSGTTATLDEMDMSSIKRDGTPTHLLPKGLRSRTRNLTRKIFKENPHLQQSHVDAVVRLAKLHEKFEQEEALFFNEDSVVENTQGNLMTNPRSRIVVALQNAIVTQERQLGISFRGQRETLTANERGEQENISNKPARTARGAPKLKLA